jgi:hypothetical protein
VGLAVAPRRRAGQALALRVTVSKRSTVAVWARRHRAVVLARRLTMPRGTNTIAWTPRRAGRHHITVAAVGVNGRRATRLQVVAIEAPPRKTRPKRKARRGADTLDRRPLRLPRPTRR